ncbi:phosphodiester glycosidase family protein [Paenibacillus lautus]|uniref:phosphodiester glycosidase family protein n=1 Tax=Paenibacillus lautus TaxID=1401 RepID=UPI003D2CE937
MTTARVVTSTWNGGQVRYIEADLDAVSVNAIPSTVMASGLYGVNGTFFSGQNLLGVAVQRIGTGQAYGVRTTSEETANACNKTTKRGVMYHIQSGSSSSVKVDVVKNFLDSSGTTRSNVRWAIGGYSLHLGKTYGSGDTDYTSYYNDINGYGSVSSCTEAKDNSENAYRLEPSVNRQRTAIGYKNGKILLVVFSSSNAWEVRRYLKSLSCTLGIMLDGGGSSQMRYRFQPNGSDSTWDAGGANRSVYSMVSVNATTWS